MRTALPVLLALTLAGCDAFGGGVDRAVVTQVAVEALDLDRPWDSPLTGDLPDVYVDVKAPGRSFSYTGPYWRSQVVENVSAVPLAFSPAPADDVSFSLDEPAYVNVVDEDFAGDDLMFTTGTFAFQERYAGEERGDTSRLVFESEDGRVTLFVRWE